MEKRVESHKTEAETISNQNSEGQQGCKRMSMLYRAIGLDEVVLGTEYCMGSHHDLVKLSLWR